MITTFVSKTEEGFQEQLDNFLTKHLIKEAEHLGQWSDVQSINVGR